jgi:ATP-dependent Clp protease adaptor protein ClpS
VEDEESLDLGWIVVVWDDPVNLMDYVVFVFQNVLAVDLQRATKLMLQVHNEGKSVVFSGMRERAEFVATRLQSHGLWTTVAR